MFQSKNLSVLGSNLLFKGLDETIINLIFNSKNFRAEKEGELIFQAGDESSYLYLILQGEVKLKYFGSKGSNSSFRRCKNEFFGEQEVLEKITRISSAIADTDCIFYLISKEELFQLISKHKAIFKNLSFTPLEEEDFEEEVSSEIPAENQNQNSDSKNPEEKAIEEIIMDEDLADYSFDSPASEELHDFHEDNYLSYSGTDDENDDLNFNGNGFHPEENNYEENSIQETFEDNFKNNELTDILPEHPENYIKNDDSAKENDLVPAINDFENIPQEPEKFAFKANEFQRVAEKPFKLESQTETESLTLIDGASLFIKNNILFPLNEINKLSDLLSKCSSLPEASQVNELIKRHISSVSSIVDSSLEFLSGKNNQNLIRKNVKNVLNNILNLLSEYVETRKVKLYKKIDTEAEVNIDEEKLYNAFFQLAKNACDSMPDGGNIFVLVVKEEDKIKIEFVDEGIGIPSSLTFDIFEPMITHGKPDGAGLGLSIARKIIQDQNGNISVDGELGEGTKVIVSFPEAAQ